MIFRRYAPLALAFFLVPAAGYALYVFGLP